MKEGIVAIIPARGGSKSIPRKNLIDFCGKPLLAWSIGQALRTESVKGVFVSTDDDDIAACAKKYGAQVIHRPATISTDTSSSESALLHALDELKTRGIDPTFVVFLQATSPLREAMDIDNAVEEVRRLKADSLFSAGKLDDFCIWREQKDGTLLSLNYDYRNRGRRQDREKEWVENGSIYVFTPAILRRSGNRLGGKIAISEMAFWKSFEIDTPEHLDLCGELWRHYGLSW